MLNRLKIENFALIREMDIRFGEGLNIITGETGAGKSILIDAIGLILGERADSGVMLDKTHKCRVEAWFSPVPDELKPLLEQSDIWIEEGEPLRVKREIAPGGKSRALVNDTVVSLNFLKETGYLLAEIHGQQDTRLINEAPVQLNLLDQFSDTAGELSLWQDLYNTWKQLEDNLKEKKEAQTEWMRNQDFIRFQFEELHDARLVKSEDEQIDNDLKRLESAEQIHESLQSAISELYEKDTSIYSRLATIKKNINRFENLDKRIETDALKLQQMLELSKEIALSLQDTADDTEAQPERLNHLQERQSLYQRLKLKFNETDASGLIDLRDQLESRVIAGDSGAEEISGLEKMLLSHKEKMLKTGLALEAKRSKNIDTFCKGMDSVLKQVGMEQASCSAELLRNYRTEGKLVCDGQLIEPAKNGINTFRILIQTNPGTPAGSLNSIASGGELSRIMLAIKSLLAQKAKTPVLIFDEIDTGISGETALKVGEVMRKLSETAQVFSITHLPQIAGKGRHQFQLYKTTQEGITRSEIRALSASERIEILARMIGGDQAGKAALESAKELLRG